VVMGAKGDEFEEMIRAKKEEKVSGTTRS